VAGETKVLTAADLINSPVLVVEGCTNAEIELAAVEVEKVVLTNCTGCTLKVR
jgi:hypothetical protein